MPPQDLQGVAGKSCESKSEGSSVARAAGLSACSSVTSLLFGHFSQTDCMELNPADVGNVLSELPARGGASSCQLWLMQPGATQIQTQTHSAAAAAAAGAACYHNYPVPLTIFQTPERDDETVIPLAAMVGKAVNLSGSLRVEDSWSFW